MMKVIGFTKGISQRTNLPVATLSCVKDYSDWQLNNGAIGQTTENIYFGNMPHERIDESLIGKEIRVFYDRGFQDKAVAVDFALA